MSRRYVPLLLALTLVWGSSFLFIEVALEDLEPTTLMALRLILAATALVPVLVARSGARAAVNQLRRTGRHVIFLGLMNAAAPFTLIAWGQEHIDSGIAAIANASVPIFVALLAIRFVPRERATGARLAGIVAGLVGVAVLAGVEPRGGWWAVAGTLAVVFASFLYAVAALYIQARVDAPDSLVLVTGSTLAGALMLLPLGLAQAPDAWPGWDTVVALVGLGYGGMAFGQVLYYWLIEFHGSTRAALVTYLLPVTALVLGVAFLDEPLTVSAVAGLALILGGVALGSGMVRPARRREPAPVHAP